MMHYSTVYFIDLDRCLIDIEIPYGEFIRQLQHFCGSEVHKTTLQLRSNIEASGGSFDPITSLLDTSVASKTAVYEALANTARYTDTTRIFLPGAKELLIKLQEQNKKFMVLTYGGEQWQTTKLRAAGFIKNDDPAKNIPTHITQQKQKGTLIASWQQPDGRFLLPRELFGTEVTADSVVLIDDKAESFAGFPSEPSKGFYVPAKVSDVTAILPSNVQQVATLHEVARYLFL